MARFTAIPESPEAADHVPTDYVTRVELHDANTGAAKVWPAKLTRCGEDPGRYGDNTTVADIMRGGQ